MRPKLEASSKFKTIIQNFMSYVNSHSENIAIAKGKNLELDPYFYEVLNFY